MGSNNHPLQTLSAHESPFQISYENIAHIPDILKERCLLGLIYFGRQKTEIYDPRIITVELPELNEGGNVEVWRAPSIPEIGYDSKGGIYYSRTDSILFGYLQFEENEFSGLEQAAYDAYQSILSCQERLGYPYLLRIWNYLPDIHREEGGLERYRAFCLGRYQVLETTPNFERYLVAATAIGTEASRMLIYFLAATEPGIRVENPRQVSAFHYPFRYAPRSPSFSRATLKQWSNEVHLYVSGTASIVGHETQHVGDPIAQLDETLNNLQALVENAQRLHGLKIKTLNDLGPLKVYLRQGVDWVSVAHRLQDRLGDSVPALFLQGDICRHDLLLEIEAFYIESLIVNK
ncbi:hypothetical conserved protein [Candidatus Nitrosoglobus terrae]|uniref:Hypothetical conserved protein n=1 Tax=Candidatus Nitrosoglobus terrae TaxID=1630141 RepID=A0A1Q2SNG7_9GAMM|nr:hypothetical protein [Candidatus Nitrosoglobus terrae]BAW80661.1 hypothetical conserved protein [Candidatus Nitrosoglobus terrae]